MKQIILLIAVLIFQGSTAHPADLTFLWSDDQTGVTGYRLYVDSGETIVKDAIPPEARTVTTPMIMDGKSHVYFLTAYNDEEESRVSDVAVVKPQKPSRVVGFKGGSIK